MKRINLFFLSLLTCLLVGTNAWGTVYGPITDATIPEGYYYIKNKVQDNGNDRYLIAYNGYAKAVTQSQMTGDDPKFGIWRVEKKAIESDKQAYFLQYIGLDEDLTKPYLSHGPTVGTNGFNNEYSYVFNQASEGSQYFQLCGSPGTSTITNKDPICPDSDKGTCNVSRQKTTADKSYWYFIPVAYYDNKIVRIKSASTTTEILNEKIDGTNQLKHCAAADVPEKADLWKMTVKEGTTTQYYLCNIKTGRYLQYNTASETIWLTQGATTDERTDVYINELDNRKLALSSQFVLRNSSSSNRTSANLASSNRIVAWQCNQNGTSDAGSTWTFDEISEIHYELTDNANNVFEGTYFAEWKDANTTPPTFAGCEQLTLTNGVFAESAGTYTYTATVIFPMPVSNPAAEGIKNRTVIQSSLGSSQWYNNNGNAVANNATKYTSNVDNFSWYIYPVLTGNTFTFQLYNVGAAKYIPSNMPTAAGTKCVLTADASSIGAYQYQAVRNGEYGFKDASAGKFITINSSTSTDQNLWLWAASGTHAGSTLSFSTVLAYTVGSITGAPDANARLVCDGVEHASGDQFIATDGSVFAYTGYDGKIAKIAFDEETINVTYRDLADSFFRMRTKRKADWVSLNAAEGYTDVQDKSGTLTNASIWHFTSTGTANLYHLQNLQYYSYITPPETFNTRIVTTMTQPAAADGWKLTKDTQGGVDYWMIHYDNSTVAEHKAQLNQSNGGDNGYALLNWYSGYPKTNDGGSEFIFQDVTDEVNAQYDVYHINFVAGGESALPTSVTCSKQMGSQSVVVHNGGFVAYEKGVTPVAADFTAYGYTFEVAIVGDQVNLTCTLLKKSYTIKYNYTFDGETFVDTESFTNQLEGNAFPDVTRSVDYFAIAKPEGVIPGTEEEGATLNYTITYTAIPEQPYPFTISTKDNPVWYYIKMRDNNYAYYDANGTDNRMTPISATRENADKYRWAFVGTPAGFKIINKAAGTSVELYTTAEGSNKYNNYFQAEGTEYITMYDEPNEGRPIYIKIKSSSHYYINKNNGFYYWDNAGALGEVGSAMEFIPYPNTDLSNLITDVEDYQKSCKGKNGWPGYPTAVGLGYLTTPLSAAKTALASGTTAEKETAITNLETAFTNCKATYNEPVAGKFYRLKSAYNLETPYYITYENNSDQADRAKMSQTSDTKTIYKFIDSHFVAYFNGLYMGGTTGNNHTWGNGTNPVTWSFEKGKKVENTLAMKNGSTYLWGWAGDSNGGDKSECTDRSGADANGHTDWFIEPIPDENIYTVSFTNAPSGATVKIDGDRAVTPSNVGTTPWIYSESEPTQATLVTEVKGYSDYVTVDNTNKTINLDYRRHTTSTSGKVLLRINAAFSDHLGYSYVDVDDNWKISDSPVTDGSEVFYFKDGHIYSNYYNKYYDSSAGKFVDDAPSKTPAIYGSNSGYSVLANNDFEGRDFQSGYWLNAIDLNGNKYISTPGSRNTTCNSNATYIFVFDYATEQTIQMSAAGWATCCLPFKSKVVSGNAEAKYVSVSGSNLVKSAADVVPAETGFLVKYTGTDEITTTADVKFAETASDATDATGNQMMGTTEEGGDTFSGEGTYYILSKGVVNEATVLGFFWDPTTNDEGASANCAQYKAVLCTSGTLVKGFSLEDDGPTAIMDVDANIDANKIYNLGGQRINKLQKGINIVNGQKVYVK